MRKYAQSEGSAKVLSPDAHKSAQDALRKRGKVSATELMTDADREKFDTELRQAD